MPTEFEHLRRFVEASTSRPYTRPDDEDVRAIGELLSLVIHDIQHGKNPRPRFTALGIKKINAGAHGFDPDRATIDSDAFRIVADLVRNEITRPEAVELFRQHIAKADDGTIRRWLRIIEPRARRTVGALDKLQKLSQAEEQK